MNKETLEEAKQELPQLGTKEFNDLASAYFGGKPKQGTTLEQIDQTNPVTRGSTALIYKKERMYSEEEVEAIAKDAYTMGRNNILIGVFNKWFEQMKKK